MKNLRYILYIIFILTASKGLSGQNVTNVRGWQEGNTAVITYTLDQMADITIQVSTDGGNTFSAPLRNVSGHVGTNVSAGNNHIVWDILAERDKLVGDDIVFKVTAVSGKRTFIVNGVSFNMIKVEGGTFTMGATSEQGSDAYDREKPAHSVTLSDYSIGETEVTQELWEAVMGSNPSYFKGDKNPVEQVSWDDCQTFIKKLNSLTGQSFRLPTEAEWEYAARGGKKSNGYKYSGSNTLGNVAWYTDNSRKKTHPVKTKQANELGLYDMSGNVFEWCSDWFDSYSRSSQVNPQGPSSGSSRVDRGGGWSEDAWTSRVSYRSHCLPGFRSSDLGFRLALP